MKNIITLSLLIVLCSCSTITGETNKQKLFSVILDYKIIQKVAIEYKKDCERGSLSDTSCKDKVNKIVSLNNKANLLIQASSSDFANESYNKSLTQALIIISQEISGYLQKSK